MPIQSGSRKPRSAKVPGNASSYEGPFPFSLTGVLASFIDPLAMNGVPIFAISTFDTDYVLVKEERTRLKR